nr:receptor like protein 42-like [Quercus suber]
MGKINPYLPLFLASCLFFISHSQTTSNTSSQQRCLPDQSSALLQLRQEFVEKRLHSDDIYDLFHYNDYYNSSYPKMKSWKADSDCCSSWDGVTCDARNGHVIGLDLSNSWLCGPLKSNSSLFRLRHLRKLNLALNNFSSFTTIPSEFGQLVRLTHLNLSNSFLHGRIPSEISWLSNLVSLDLSFNYFHYFVGADSHETYLNLRRNDLEALVQNMTYLRELHLDYLDLPWSLPQSLANLSSLTSLSLSWCILLGEFPSDIFLLPQIQSIDVSRNDNLAGFLPEFNLGNSLELLDLSRTNFSGELPDSINNLKSLKYLYLSSTNFFGEIPNSISNLKSLTGLALSGNLSGEIFHSILNLSQLVHLSISSNNFHGQLPSTLGNLTKLIYLDLSNNLFHGEIPSFLGNLTQLEYLSLRNNTFDGRFPILLTNLTKLQYLDISTNQLIGPIPCEIGKLPQLSYITLGYNSLSGAIPSSLFTMTSLSRLSLSQNHLTGPLKIQNISSSPLQTLLLSGNKLYEPIPRSISNFSQLEYLALSSINVKGMMELNIFFELKRIKYLSLSGNNLLISKGKVNSPLPKFQLLDLSFCNLREFPDFLETQNELAYLDLSSNKIEGKVPKWFWNVGKETLQRLNLSFNLLSSFEQPLKVLPWKNMAYLDLRSNMLQGLLPIPPLSTNYFFASNNSLTGRIPPMICQVNSLQVLDLSNNQLTGQIPQCLGKFSTSLAVLNMRSNRIQGKLPKTFIKGSNLRTLDVSRNQIKGKIPRSLAKCIKLEVLNLGNNNMNDIFPFWLESLPELQILILRANGFYGPIRSPHTNVSFSKLHVIDLSHNNFSGRLPSENFKTWNAMLMVHGKINSKPEYMGDDSGYYEDSITVMNKGIEMELVKILTIFISIDLSNNRFSGEIPNTMGNLKELIVLNLSSNSFTGPIPSCFGNLTELQSLDLSQNKFLGEIPQQLTSLTFLAYLNLSHNQLIGPIPQGRQFGTFQNSSFEGNLRLCGFPLSKKCENIETTTFWPSQESSFGEGFNWKVVMIGYASGLLVGLVIGHVIISRKLDWFARTFRVNLHIQ